jgi:hypothetical protein
MIHTFRNKDKSHCEQKVIKEFQGNMMFASLDQLTFKSTSRKDDLHSLSYLLIYLINDLEFPDYEENGDSCCDVSKYFLKIR